MKAEYGKGDTYYIAYSQIVNGNLHVSRGNTRQHNLDRIFGVDKVIAVMFLILSPSKGVCASPGFINVKIHRFHQVISACFQPIC